MRHLSSFGLNNFRVFNTETDFELRPITILTGTNSSGKSSFIKGLQVMKLAFNGKNPILDSLDEINLNEVKNLGGFDLLKNRNNDSPVISFKLPFVLRGVFNQMVLKLNYTSDRSALKKAELISLKVMDEQETIILYDYSFYDDQWNLKINFSELYQLLRDSKKISTEYNVARKSLYIEKGLNHEYRVKTENYDQVLKEIETKNPELASFIKYDDDKSKSVSFYETLGFQNLNIKFDLNNFLFPFIFLFEAQYTEGFISKNLSKDEVKILSDLREAINGMNVEETKEFYQEFVEGEKKLLELMTFYFGGGGGRKPLIDLFDNLTDSNAISIAFHKLAGKNIESIFGYPGRRNLFEDEDLIPQDLDSKDIVKDSCDFFIKNKINRNFLMLLGKHREVFEKNCDVFFNFFCNKGFEIAIEKTQRSFQCMDFIPSIRSQAGRVFHHDPSNYLNQILLEFYKTRSNSHSDSMKFLNQYVKEFKIADRVTIVHNADSLTTAIHFIKNEQQINIADLGYGISQLLPILIRIAININISDSLYGITEEQLRIQKADTEYYPTILVIEEPETNLHPALQSKLADLFVECYEKYNIQFIIETHSEYFIRKLQYKIAKEEFNHKDANIYYFNDPESEAYKSEVVYKIDIEKNGILSRPFGAGFFDESNNLNMSLYLLTKDTLN
jgi:predicted ATPase